MDDKKDDCEDGDWHRKCLMNDLVFWVVLIMNYSALNLIF